MNSKARGVWAAVLVCMSVSLAARAQVVPRVRTVSEKAFQHPNLFVPEVTEDLTMLPAPLVQRLRPTLASFGVAQESIFFDSRTGRPTSVILRQPMLPGSGRDNHLAWTAGKPLSDAALGDAAWRALRTYLIAHKADLRLDPSELSDSPRIGVVENGALIFIHVPRVVGGIPVRDNSIGAAINHGNLILLGMQKWGDVNVPAPALSAQAAKMRSRPSRLVVDPAVPAANRTSSSFPWRRTGRIDYRLAWVVTLQGGFATWAPGKRSWTRQRHAHRVQGPNQYGQAQGREGGISGGVSRRRYPISNDQFLPIGIEQPNGPMSFVDYTINGVTQLHGRRRQRRLHSRVALDGAQRPVPEDRRRLRRDQRNGHGRDRSRLGTHARGDGLRDSRRPLRRRHQVEPDRATTS